MTTTTALKDLEFTPVYGLVAAWRAAGLDPAIDTMLVAHGARFAQLRAATIEFLDDTVNVSTLGRAVADGRIDFATAVSRHAQLGHERDARAVADTAGRFLESDLHTELARIGTRFITDHLEPRERALLADIRDAAVDLGDTSTPEAAFAAGGNVVTAWHTIAAAVEIREALTDVQRALAGHRALPATVTWDYPDPDALPSRSSSDRTQRREPLHPVAWLAQVVLAGIGGRVLLERVAIDAA